MKEVNAAVEMTNSEFEVVFTPVEMVSKSIGIIRKCQFFVNKIEENPMLSFNLRGNTSGNNSNNV